MFGPMSVASSRGSPWRSAAARSRKRAVNSPATRSSTSSLVPARHTCPALSYWPDGVGDGEVQVGVGEHQQRGLAAQLQRDRGQLGAGRGGDQAAGRDRAGEADPGHGPGCAASGAPASGAQALHDVEHAVGQPGVAGDVGQQARGQRRPLRRLGDHGVPGRERGGDPPGRQHQRRVPRRDHRGDAGRGPGHLLPVSGDLQVPGVELAEPVGEEPEVVRHPRHHAAPVRAQQRAVVAVSTWASSSARRSMPSAIAFRILARCSGGVAAQPPKASRAARTAASTSAAAPRAISASGRSSMGEMSVKVAGGADPAAADPVPGVDVDAGHAGCAHRLASGTTCRLAARPDFGSAGKTLIAVSSLIATPAPCRSARQTSVHRDSRCPPARRAGRAPGRRPR